MKQVICICCNELHLIGKPTKPKKLDRFHGRWFTTHANKPATYEPSALSTNSKYVAKQLAKDHARPCSEWVIWDYKTGKQVCPIKGIDWTELK